MLEPNKTPEARAILNLIDRRIKKKLACMIIFTGGLGSGKSYGGSRLLELWYLQKFNEEFPIAHVVEELDQAILLVKDFDRPGEGIMIEELSVLASARDSLTKTNKLWNKFLDTCRIKQAVIIANAPHLSFIDKHYQMLAQIWIECLGVNFRKKIVIAKPLRLQTSQHSNKIYKHKFVGADGFALDLCFFSKPSKEFCKAYDELKMRNVNNMYDEIAQKMLIEKKKQLKELGKKILAPREKEAHDYYLKGVPAKEAYLKMGLSHVKTYYTYLNNAKKKVIDNNNGKIPKKIG